MFINLTEHLIPDGIHQQNGMREEISTVIMGLMAKQSSLLVAFIYIVGMTRLGTKPAILCFWSK